MEALSEFQLRVNRLIDLIENTNRMIAKQSEGDEFYDYQIWKYTELKRRFTKELWGLLNTELQLELDIDLPLAAAA